MLFKTVSPDTVFILKNNNLLGDKQWLGQIELKDNEWRAWVNSSSGWWTQEQLLRLTAKVGTLNASQRALAHTEEETNGYA